MRKKAVVFMAVSLAVLIFGWATASSAQSGLSLGVIGGYYSPSFGEINDDFEEVNILYGTDLELKAGIMYGAAVNYDINPQLRVRLEYDIFKSKTSGEGSYSYVYDSWLDGYYGWGYYWYYEDWVEETIDAEFELTTTPIILSGIYKFSPFYVGAGVGSFPTTCKSSGTLTEDYYLDEYLYDSWYGGYTYMDTYYWYTDSFDLSEEDSDSPTGFLVIAGVELGGEKTFFNLEARYIPSLKANFDTLGTSADLGGFQVNLLAGFRF
ncbi:MAG: hypothetical protein U9O41_10290 [Candidatus Aerophobetes bacterium]|nr:hypothetical protein [Candidatus Aerophobetes bacterium]